MRESIIDLIFRNYENFTATERIVADYFMHNRLKDDFSSKNITSKLFVSESTLSRFSQKCGFRGYREFVFRYEESFIENSENISGGIEYVLNSYHEILNQMVNINEEQILRFVNLMTDAKQVLVIGVGSSGLAATEMKNRFMRLGVLMESVSDVDEMRMKSVFQTQNNLVIGISLSGEKKEVLFSLQHAFNNGAKTVLITANKENSYSFCTEKITCPSFSDLAQGNLISPQFPILVILDICYNYFLYHQKNLDDRIELHKKTVEVLKQFS